MSQRVESGLTWLRQQWAPVRQEPPFVLRSAQVCC
jgi:hypothetical protein